MSKKKTKQKRARTKRVRRSAYKAFKEAGLIGCPPGLPKDLSTNKKYFEGFGKSEADS